MQFNPYRPPESADPKQGEPTERRGKPHSGAGIASLVLGVVGVLFICGGFASAAANLNAEHTDELSPQELITVLWLLGGFQFEIIGVVLGLAGAFMVDRNRLFAFIGIVINGTTLFGLGLLFLLGLAGVYAE